MADIAFHHSLVLPARPTFRWSASLRALASYPPCAKDHLRTAETARMALVHPSRPSDAVLVEVAGQPPPPAGVTLRIAAAAALTPAEVDQVGTAVSRWLGLDDDLSGFLATARGDPAVAPMLADVSGLHQVRFPSLAEGASY